MKRLLVVRYGSTPLAVAPGHHVLSPCLVALLICVGFHLCGSFALGQDNAGLVRLAAVNTPYYTGLLDALLVEFKRESGLEVWIYSNKDVYEQARAGNADIVISHYGKEGVESFVMEGYGLWPRTLFTNQATLIGPEDDPANVRGLPDAAEAFRRIAATGSTYVVNNNSGFQYLTEILWEAAGRPEKGPWFVEPEAEHVEAVTLAEKKGGYVLYGAFPFLRYKEAAGMSMEALVVDDPLLKRIMVSVVVNPDKVSGVNCQGAQALQKYLLTPKAQAIVRDFRVSGSDARLWCPAGRSNDPRILGD